MQLLLRDPAYTQRLAAFLNSVGQDAVVAAPDRVDLVGVSGGSLELEVELYLRVWRILYPDAEVERAVG